MINAVIKINLLECKAIQIRLKGDFFFNDTQRRLFGSWNIYIQEGKIFIENEEEIIIASDKALLVPVDKDTCVFFFNENSIEPNQHFLTNLYKGNLTVVATNSGLRIENEIDVELLIVGILSKRFPLNKQLEFLKTQAYLLRNYFLKYKRAIENSGLVNDLGILKSDSIGCDKEYSLASYYQGIPLEINSLIIDAVDQTRGAMVVYNDLFALLPQTFCCGGMTNEEFVCDDRKYIYTKGIYDAEDMLSVDLSQYKDFEHWVYHPHDVYCSTWDPEILQELGCEDEQHSQPFRWNKVIEGDSLSAALNKMPEVNIGMLDDLIVQKRATSGAVMELCITGSKGEVVLDADQLNVFIQSIHLQSGSFMVEKSKGNKNGKLKFTFNGTGMGRLAGMCQIGAMNMAANGATAVEILQHYFPGVYIEKQY
jgi:peptidoglycan hydrolase-like amidase